MVRPASPRLEMDLSGVTFESVRLHHLPLVREAFDELGILSVIEDVFPKHPEAVVSDADCLLLMCLNILQGRCALYRMHEWLQHLDADVIIGENCPKKAFTDTRLAQTLDRFFAFGLDNLFARIAAEILKAPKIPGRALFRGDTTSLVLHGAYDIEPEEGAPVPAYGYSKDKRPDLKQLMLSLCLDQANRPRAFFPLDGNTGEQPANRQLLQEVARQMKPTDGATWVGDAKLVDADTIGQLLDNDFHFISLCFQRPSSFVPSSSQNSPRITSTRSLTSPAARSVHPEEYGRRPPPFIPLPEVSRDTGRLSGTEVFIQAACTGPGEEPDFAYGLIEIESPVLSLSDLEEVSVGGDLLLTARACEDGESRYDGRLAAWFESATSLLVLDGGLDITTGEEVSSVPIVGKLAETWHFIVSLTDNNTTLSLDHDSTLPEVVLLRYDGGALVCTVGSEVACGER